MGRVLRGALVVVVIVVVVAAVSVGGLLGSITASGQPQQSGTIHVPGLAADATVSRDVSGVTHIAAGTSHDLFFAQGWVHASERMWQMEIWRRIGAGRLAELFGDEPGRHRLVHPHRRLARRRGARPRRPVGRDPLLPGRLRGRGQRASSTAIRTPSACRSSSPARSQARAPDWPASVPSPGRRSTPSPGPRSRPGAWAATWTARSSGCWPMPSWATLRSRTSCSPPTTRTSPSSRPREAPVAAATAPRRTGASGRRRRRAPAARP